MATMTAVEMGLGAAAAVEMGQGVAAPVGDGEWHIGTAAAGYGPSASIVR